MKSGLNRWSERYRVALRRGLNPGRWAKQPSAYKLGREALALGLQTLDIARAHEQAVVRLVPASASSEAREDVLGRARAFFIETLTPIEETHLLAMKARARLRQLIETVQQQTVQLNAAGKRLRDETRLRVAAEESLKQSQEHYRKLLDKARVMQEQLRLLSRQVLLAQEAERREISRELHDDIAQTLSGINVHLAALSREASADSQNLRRKIARTQRLVVKSVDIVHRFARELRPTLLDDLGLIPALHAFMKDFTKRTGLRIQFTVFAGAEQLSSLKRTVLYRVAQAALTNVAQHAEASRVKVSIRRLGHSVVMTIKDDGKSFDPERVLLATGRKRLGLLGMRERVDMVGGRFTVESTPGRGTTVRAQVPFRNGHRPKTPPSL